MAGTLPSAIDRQASPLVLAKTHLPPRRADILRRPRLVDQLYAHIEKQLFLVSAPAGYGKTSLLLDFAHDAEFPVAWYALDEFDNAPHIFLEYLIASIRVHFPAFGAQALATLERVADSLEALQPVVAMMANDLFSLPDHLIIVLDDYHAIHNEMIDNLLKLLIDYAGENCHIFLDSRTVPRIPDQILLLARGQMSGLGANELKFTPAEIQALVQQNFGLTLSDERARELALFTDGWITALLLMGHQAGWRELVESAVTAPDAAGRVYDFLAEQVFSHQPADTQRFLLASSLLEPLAPNLLDSLPGVTNARKHLETLHKQQLFVTRLGGNDELYTYHPLFREFLKARLFREQPAWHEQLSLASAKLYAEQGQWERVVEIYLSMGRVDDAARALESAEESLRTTAQVSSLAPWFEALPRTVTEFRPHLLSLKAKSYFFRGGLGQAANYFDRAANMFLESGDRAAAADKLIWKAYALQGLGHYRKVVEESAVIDGLLTNRPDLVWHRATNLANRGLSENSLGDLTHAYGDLTQAKELSLAADDLVLQANVTRNLGMVARASGRLSEALEHYSTALRLWERLQNPNAAADTLNNLGYIYYLKGETQEAERILNDALSRARAARALRTEAIILSSLGDLHKDYGDYLKALELFGDSLRVALEAHFAYATVYCKMATGDTYRLIGDLARAREWLDSALEGARLSGSSVDIGQVKFALSLLACDEGRLEEAIATTAEVSALFRQAGNNHLEALSEFQLAHALNLEGRTNEAVPHLVRTAELVELLGYDHFLVVEGRRAELTLRLASTLDTAGPKFRRILERVRPLPAHHVKQAPASPAAPIVAVYTLGHERFTVGGVELSQLRPQVRELFLYLLARYPHAVRRDELWELIWPDMSAERADSGLRVAVTRIRKALCRISWSNGWYALAPERLWYDVHEFERGVADAYRSQSAGGRIHRLRQALELYSGEYLARMEAQWVTVERERLKKAYLKALLSLAEAYSEVGDLGSALRTYESAANAEPFLEEAWQGGMRTDLRMGNRVAALARYEQLKHILRDELGIDPSPQVQALYRRIINMSE